MYKKIYILLFNFFFLFPQEQCSAKNFETGEILFQKNCSICHFQGKNLIIPEKNLTQKSLEINGMNNLSSITYQIMNGKNGMPSFGGRLTEEKINEISKYVLIESKVTFKNN